MIYNNPYFQYALMISLLGNVALDMKQRIKFSSDNYGLYYDGSSPGSRIYVGNHSMINKRLFEPITTEVIQDLYALHGKELTDRQMTILHGPEFKPHTKRGCGYCNGYGTWEDGTPLMFEEINWVLAAPCGECDSHNHDEYLAITGRSSCDTDDLPWENNKSIGFYAALKKFSRSIQCAELLDTQDTKTAQK